VINFWANSVFRASAACSKILEEKHISIQWKISGQTVFQGKRKLFKILNDKKYVFNTVNSGHTLFFRASAGCSKILIIRSIFNRVKNFRANSVFQGKRMLFKILNEKKNILNTLNSGTVFQGKHKLLKNPEDKKYFNTVKNFRTISFFRVSASC